MTPSQLQVYVVTHCSSGNVPLESKCDAFAVPMLADGFGTHWLTSLFAMPDAGPRNRCLSSSGSIKIACGYYDLYSRLLKSRRHARWLRQILRAVRGGISYLVRFKE